MSNYQSMRQKQSRPVEVHTPAFLEDVDKQAFENFCKEITVCPIIVENQDEGLSLNEGELRRLKHAILNIYQYKR